MGDHQSVPRITNAGKFFSGHATVTCDLDQGAIGTSERKFRRFTSLDTGECFNDIASVRSSVSVRKSEFGWNRLSTPSQSGKAGSRRFVDSTFRTESLLSIPLPPPTEDFIIGQSRLPVSKVDKLAGPIMNAGESILLQHYTHNSDCDSIIRPSSNLPTLRCVAERMKSENYLGRFGLHENILQKRGFSLESNPGSRPLTSALNGERKSGGNAASCFSSEKRSLTQISCKSIPTPIGLSESHLTASVQNQAQNKCIQTDDHLLGFSRQTSPANYRPPTAYSIFGALEDILDFASDLLAFRKHRQYYPPSDFLSHGVMGKVIQTRRSTSKPPIKRSSLRRPSRERFTRTVIVCGTAEEEALAEGTEYAFTQCCSVLYGPICRKNYCILQLNTWHKTASYFSRHQIFRYNTPLKVAENWFRRSLYSSDLANFEIFIIIDSMTSVLNTDASLPYNHDLFERLIAKKRIKMDGEET
ncbi:hypothetical protein CLF_100253 [Clonorchis sinensis]|uniref:Uncharacterized protein n=1 Tax=Clonorchis sinensis TaxID=79923 RepID=G7Y318_CLOSI|nr:hypothetical protein CLF_100253 [Clonorchis sinensis]